MIHPNSEWKKQDIVFWLSQRRIPANMRETKEQLLKKVENEPRQIKIQHNVKRSKNIQRARESLLDYVEWYEMQML